MLDEHGARSGQLHLSRWVALKGHGFSRAAKQPEISRASQVAEKVPLKALFLHRELI
jgi:hypothetical protein